MYVAGQPIHGNSQICLANGSGADHRALILLFLILVEKDGLTNKEKML